MAVAIQLFPEQLLHVNYTIKLCVAAYQRCITFDFIGIIEQISSFCTPIAYGDNAAMIGSQAYFEWMSGIAIWG